MERLTGGVERDFDMVIEASILSEAEMRGVEMQCREKEREVWK